MRFSRKTPTNNPLPPALRNHHPGGAEGLSNAVVSTAQIAADTYKAGVQAQVTGQLLHRILDRIADPRLLLPIARMAAAAGEGFLHARIFDHQAAVEPAAHVLNAATDIQRECAAVRAWAFARERRRSYEWFHPALYWRRRQPILTEQIQRLANILWAAAGECDLAGGQILQKYNPVSALVPTGMVSASAPDLRQTHSPIPMPTEQFHTTKEQVLSVGYRIGMLADYLHSMAERCIANIEASRDHHSIEVSANVVRAEGALIVQQTVEALAACGALYDLANQALAAPKRNEKRGAKPDKRASGTSAVPAPADPAPLSSDGLGPPAPAA